MRKDIEIHINTGDVTISNQGNNTIRDFRWVENPVGLNRYIYGEIDIPSHIPESSIKQNGFCTNIPYTPQQKEFMIRIRRVYNGGNYEYVLNDTDGSNWFIVKTGLYGGEMENAWASKLVMVSQSDFYININKGVAELYSADQSAFNIIKADRQNANCMLACFPSNNYRYPATGVGLIRWINSGNINSTDLSSVIHREFSADGVLVRSAHYNYDTKQLELDMHVD